MEGYTQLVAVEGAIARWNSSIQAALSPGIKDV